MTDVEFSASHFLVLVLGALLSVGGSRASYAQSGSAVKTVHDTVALAPTGVLEVENQKGRISVTTWDRAAVGYEVRIVSPEGDDSTPLTALDVTHEETRLALGPDFPWRIKIPGVITVSPGGAERPRLQYTITMPRSARLRIDDYTSTISITGVEGGVQLDTYTGSVQGTGLRGELDLGTYTGSVQVGVASLSAPVKVDTYTGTVHLTLPPDAGFALETDLRDGDQLTVEGPWTLPAPTDGNYEGAVNGGGPPLSIEVFTGAVTLRASDGP